MKTLSLKYALSLAAFMLPLFLHAQNYNFRFDIITSENTKVEKGLSVNGVSCITQDLYGYMWFGTWDGLNKFDGYKFTVFKSNELGKNTDLSNQTIRSLLVDKEGTLWVGTEEGINKYEREKQTFQHFKHVPSSKSSLSNDTVRVMYEDSYGNIWVGTQNGLNLFNKTSGTFTLFSNVPGDTNSISGNLIYDIFEDKDGFLWVATNNGLNKYNLLSKKFRHYLHEKENSESIPSDTVTSICQDKKGILWIGTNNGLCSLNTGTCLFATFKHDLKNLKSISSNIISDVYEDSEGMLWIGTSGNGVNIFDRSNNEFIHFQNTPNDQNTISNNNVSAIFEDKAGIIWIATEIGVNKIDRNSYKFKHIRHIENDENSLGGNVVYAFKEDPKDSNLWIGTTTGLNYYDRTTEKFTIYKHNPADPNSLSSNDIKAIITDSDGNYWIGTTDAGLDEFVKTGEGKYSKISIKQSLQEKNSLSNNTVYCLQEDSDGFIWIGTEDGLNRYDRETNEIKIFRHNSYNPYSISNNKINVLFEDSYGILWIGTWNGLNRYDKKSGKFYAYKHSSDSSSISSNRVFGICEDKSKTMWIGTWGGGLNHFDRKTGAFKYYTEKDGLSNNMVYCMLEDNAGNLWCSTNNGISKFNILTETFINYDVKDGIQSSEFNQNAMLKSNNGEFFFGGMNGFNEFFPEKIGQNKYSPPIVITAFKIFNETIRDEVPDNDTIYLNYYDNFFSFEFSSLDYSNPVKNKYAYKLENYDKEWKYCDANRRFADYTNVSPGTYKFRVRGTNSDGVWNDTGISITIIISPPWWSTWTFRVIFILFVIVSTWFFLSRRFRQLQKKHEFEKKVLEIEKQLFDLEQKSLRLQMNPHFIFNSLNSIQSFIVNNDSDRATLYLAKFAQLMRLILANSSEPFVAVKDELKALVYYMDIENLRFDNKFDYSISVDPEIDDDFIGIPPMIIQPYVENAILHGILNKQGRGKITIKLNMRDQEDSIHCIVEDDGVGREKAEEIKSMSGLKHKSRGMIITKERLEILNKQVKGKISVNVNDMKDADGKASGTKVEIIIPFIEI
jgi:two-component system, sensor histidine kinase ChiS